MSSSVKRRIRVLHFVSGGFSGGATQVAIQLTEAALAGAMIEPLLVLRRKRHTAKSRVRELEQRGLPVATVPGWSHVATVVALVQLCRRFKPDVLAAHGFSEHLWGRYAGLIAEVPALVHVEHNTRERYTRWRLAQAHWLARRTARIVACGPGVFERLRELGFSADQTQVIANGIDLAPFASADEKIFAEREPAIMMVARFGAQKDHPTLIRAIAELRKRGCKVPLYLAGGGKERHRERAMRLALKDIAADRKVNYINAHGTSTPVGDVGEVEAVRRVFGRGQTPLISSTKSMTGHSQGATGAQEAVYCLLMLEHDFITPSINVETLDPAIDAGEIATSLIENAGLDTVMTNSFGFGGTNGSMLLSKYRG